MPRIGVSQSPPKLLRDHEKITVLFFEGRLSLSKRQGSVATGALRPSAEMSSSALALLATQASRGEQNGNTDNPRDR